jgi:hypothetical protein
MMRLLSVALLLAACGGSGNLLPDGGRQRVVCQNNPTSIAVKAQDIMGVPISDADVIAKNGSSGKIQTSRTGGNGFAAGITDDLGNGQIEISATAGSLATRQPFIIQLLCGDCDCTAMPASATLTLE